MLLAEKQKPETKNLNMNSSTRRLIKSVIGLFRLLRIGGRIEQNQIDYYKTKNTFKELKSEDYLILRSESKYSFKVPNPNFIDINDYLSTVDAAEQKYIQQILELDFTDGTEVVLFRNTKGFICVIGRSFTGWAPEITPKHSITIFKSKQPDSLELLNMHPAKGPGYGSLYCSENKLKKELIIFFLIKANYKNWDDKFEETNSFIEKIELFLNQKVTNTIKQYNA